MNLVWKPSNEKSFAFSFRCLSFSPSNKSGLGKLWQILDFMFTFENLIFRWTLYKVDISIKQTLVMHQWCPFYRGSTVASWVQTHWVQPKILVLINFLSLNFTSMEIKRGRVSSSQNERTWGGECSKTNWGKQGGQNLGILSEHTFWMSPYANHVACIIDQHFPEKSRHTTIRD